MNLENKKGTMLVLATAVISGFSIFINKFGVKGVDPYFYTYIKNFAAGAILVSMLLLAKNWKSFGALKKKDKINLLLIGLIGGSIPFLFFFKGLTMTSAFKASFIHKTLFIYVGILATVFLKEKITKSMLFGLASMVLGSVLFLKVKPASLNIGDLYIFIAALLWAVEIVIAKKVLSNVSGTMVGAVRLFLGSFFVLLFLLLTGRAELFTTINFDMVKWGIISGVILAAYNFTFYNGLKYLGATEAASILTLGAPITGVLTVIFLNGKMGSSELFGIGFIVLGVVLMSDFIRNILKLNKLFSRKTSNELA